MSEQEQAPKACSYCGAELQEHITYYHEPEHGVQIVCEVCEMSGPVCEDMDSALQEWNKLQSVVELEAQVKALNDDIQDMVELQWVKPMDASMDNVDASKLASISREVGTQTKGVGDSIDRGLILLRRLKEEGYLLHKITKAKES